MKHLEIRSLALQEWREQKHLKFVKVPTETNPSDVLTKPMARDRLVALGAAVGPRGGPFGGESDTMILRWVAGPFGGPKDPSVG